MPLPVPEPRRPGPLLIVAGLVVLSVVIGILLALLVTSGKDPVTDSADARDVATPLPRPPSGSAAATRITVAVFNCAGCEISARPADGQPALTAPVVNGQALFTVPSQSTVGMSFQVIHPAGFGAVDGSNVAVLSTDGATPGARVGASALIKSRWVWVCWAGTRATDAVIGLVVEPFSTGSPAGDLRAWADPALKTLPAYATNSAYGTVEDPATDACAGAYRTAVAQTP